MLMLASNIHKNPAAIQRAELYGIKNNATVLSTAPNKKYGRLLPNLDDQVLSLKYPIIGWTISPVNGAAIHSIGISSAVAPKVSNILDIFPP